MITQLKKRARVDALKNDVRAGGIAWGRYLYLAMLISLFLFLLNFFVGSYLFLKADGLVIKDTYTVSPLYTARIKKVFVKPGDTVKKGQPLLELESSTLMLQLATIATEVAKLTSQTAQLKAKTNLAEVLLPTAKEHAQQTNRTLKNLSAKNKEYIVTSSRVEEAFSNKIKANSKLSQLEAEASVYRTELRLIESAELVAKRALNNLKRIYNDGKVNAPIDGIVGTKLVNEGAVVLVGKPLLQVFAGKAYVLAFLPKNYLFGLAKAQEVTIKSGSLKATGVIEKMLPVAASLPKEFQNAIKPTGRQQLIRINLPDNHPFVISQNVMVRGSWSYKTIKATLLLQAEHNLTSLQETKAKVARFIAQHKSKIHALAHFRPALYF